MKATSFEYRRQTLLHVVLVGLALLTYVIDPDDIVWALVRRHSDSALLERMIFGVGAVTILSSAVLETWARAYGELYALRIARLLFASALGLLLPLPGAVTLVVGEVVLVFRLSLRDRESNAPPANWVSAFRTAASKWGLAASMIVFTITLRDRIAEFGAAISFLIWLALNIPSRRPR